MNPATKKDLGYVASVGTVIVGALVGGIVAVNNSTPPKPAIILAWTNAPGAVITVVEGTTNGIHWRRVGVTTNVSTFSVMDKKPYEFFRVYHPNWVGHYWDMDRYNYNSNVFRIEP